ncbi:MAG: DUF2523 domain-containing protein [Nitrospinae bacterium]|nr:DUF2523 domain-containing protein [Nitrospinota bacterium]
MDIFDVQGWLNYLIDGIVNIVETIFDGLWNIFGEILLFIVDAFLDVVDWVISLISSMLPTLNIPTWWGQIGADALGILGYIQVDTGIGIVVAALLIRLILNFIPFIG